MDTNGGFHTNTETNEGDKGVGWEVGGREEKNRIAC
jgi:hypothetical protein